MANETEHAADTPDKNEQGRFQFSLTQMLVVTAACAVYLGVGSWTGDFIILPPLIGIVILLEFKTRDGVARGLILGLTLGCLVGMSLPDSLANEVGGIIYLGASGAAWGGAIHSIMRGHDALGWWMLIVLCLLGGLMLYLMQPMPQPMGPMPIF